MSWWMQFENHRTRMQISRWITGLSDIPRTQRMLDGYAKVGLSFQIFRCPLISLADVAAKYLETEDKSILPKVLQFSSEDKFTKYEICELFADIMGTPLRGMKPNAEGNDPKAAVQRPYDCHLSTQALKDLGIDTNTMDFKGWWRREMRAFRH